MANRDWPTQSKRLAEDIALLSLINGTPSPPTVTPVQPSPAGDQPERSFSIDRECSLADSLAFVSSLSDNPNHIIALALEETASPKALKVVIAINKSSVESGDGVLGRIKLGFESIFRTLSRARLGN